MPVPAELSELWNFLHPEVVWLHGRWIVYRQLYGTSPERIDLINKASPMFFWMVERVLMNDVQLTLCKLADPATTGRRENLTLETFLFESKKLKLSELSKKLHDTLKEYRACCEKIKQRRNKDIAHFDRLIQLGDKAIELPVPSRQEIETALAELRRFMNHIWGEFDNTQMAYEHFSLNSDANQLLFVVKEGLRYEQLQDLGTIGREDILSSPYIKF
jgi:hypothetical protein